VANSHDYVLCFSSRGKAYWLKVYQIPQAGSASRGRPIVNLLPLEEGERINAILPVKAFEEDKYVFLVTKSGTVTLRFVHKYSFEFDGTRWDGGQVRISIRG